MCLSDIERGREWNWSAGDVTACRMSPYTRSRLSVDRRLDPEPEKSIRSVGDELSTPGGKIRPHVPTQCGNPGERLGPFGTIRAC